MKKGLKIFGITILVLIIILFTAPFLFKDQIKAKITQSINENLNAKVAFEDIDLGFLKNFPNANVTLTKLSVINKAPFLGDTLIYAEDMNFKMSIKELFKGENEAKKISGIFIKNALINIIIDKNGIGNYDVAIKKEEETKPTESKPFAMSINQYSLENVRFKFHDQKANLKVKIDELFHSGSGDLTSEQVDLDTKTTLKLDFENGGVKLVNNVSLKLDAVLAMDMKNNKYTFKDNELLINQLPLNFKGFVQIIKDEQYLDLSFNTPTTSFQNFLALIPEAYSGNIKDVKTTGDFTVKGIVKGKKTVTTLPTFDINIASNNASFQYPNLPKAVKNIIIDTKIINTTGLMNDTYIAMNKLSFSIDQDVFDSKFSIKNFAENPLIDFVAKGIINLANVSKAYPIKLDKPLTGILNANVAAKFDMNSVKNKQYQNIQNSGNVSITGFNYESPEMAKPFKINKAAVTFNTGNVQLNTFDAKTGDSDLNVNGTLENIYGFMLNNQELKGVFNMSSNKLLVSDFMAPSKPNLTTKDTKETSETKKTSETVKIPAFLNCTINAKANTVVYDNLTLQNVSGTMKLQDQSIVLQNIVTNIFNGSIGFNGLVSTKNKQPNFNMDMKLNAVDIAQTFTQIEMLKKIAPIAGIINGKLNSSIKFSGNLDAKKFTPDLKTLSGDLLGQLLSTTINEEKSTLLKGLSNNIKFIDINKLNLNDIKASLRFEDGKVNVKPMNFKYQDINIELGGTHGFDQSINYNAKFDVPAKYLGNEVSGLLNKMSPDQVNKLQNIPVNAVIAGNFTNPKITTDMKSAVTHLSNQIIEQQKQKLVGKGVDALSGLLGGKKTNPTDTTKTNSKQEVKKNVEEKAKGLINGLFGNKKKE
ncbi:MAG: AsmA-like C-terminal region-containing protein [Flavobacterium sp.]